MIQETLTYTDFNGKSHTEDFFFNLSTTELAEMHLNQSRITADGEVVDGGMDKMLQDILASGDGKRIISVFKDFLFMSYGEKSEDGKRFMKSPELSQNFACSAAYDVLFMKLIGDVDYAAKFVTALLPENLEAAAGMSASEKARKKSEEAMKGRMQVRKPEVVTKTPDLVTSGTTTATTAMATPPQLTPEEIQTALANRQQSHLQ